MSLTPEEYPNGMSSGQELDPSDWLGPKNIRDLVHNSRGTLLSEIRSVLDTLEPQLASIGGLAFYETYAEDASRVGILVTTRPEIASPNSTVISINKFRQPEPDEPVFPDGRVMELLDVTFYTKNGNWMSWAWEDLYLYHHDKKLEAPEFATLQEPKSNTLRLLGNLANNGTFAPESAQNTQDVEFGVDVLWEAWEAIQLCTPTTLQDHITTITTE